MKIVILGVTGMLGNAMFRVLSSDERLEVYGTARNESSRKFFADDISQRILTGVDVGNHDSLISAIAEKRPDVVINCVGLIKQLSVADEPLQAIPINTLLPHRLASLCQLAGIRLVHVSTDCVFSGAKGNYLESDFPDANDLYGRSKLLGEVAYSHTITLRTSIIGHELSSQRSLIGWFLKQQGSIKGFKKAIFSGLPTVTLAHVIHDIILQHPELCGLYHVAAKPISKFDLLQLVASVYGKSIDIIPDESLVIDRSLNADKFHQATGFVPPEWPELVRRMSEFR